jgi:hypothetical protein
MTLPASAVRKNATVHVVRVAVHELSGQLSLSSCACEKSVPMLQDDAGQTIDQSQDFAWCSLDPVLNILVPYPERQTHHLESAFRAGRQHVTILVPAQEVP